MYYKFVGKTITATIYDPYVKPALLQHQLLSFCTQNPLDVKLYFLLLLQLLLFLLK